MTDTPPPQDPTPDRGSTPHQGTAPGQPMRPEDEKLWSTLIHLGGPVVALITANVLAFLPALIGYLVLRDRGPFIRDNSRNALNFQITVIIATIVAYILTFVTFGILFILPIAVFVVNVVFGIIAAVKANQGVTWKYPLSIAFVR